MTWFGGNFLGEHQVALLNPVSLAVYAAMPSVGNYALAATLLACFYNGLLAAGAYSWGRALGLRSPAAWTLAFVACANNFLTYWYSGNWFAPFVSIVWFVWSWSFLLRAGQCRRDWVLAALCCYLTITAGWPQTTLLLGLVTLLIAIENLRDGGVRYALAPLSALVAAVLLAAPALLPLFALGEVASRGSEYWNSGFLIPDLRDVLWLSSPFHVGHFAFFGGFDRVSVPHFFVAWFVLPLLPFVRWELWDWRRAGAFTLVAFGAVCLLATRGPEQLGPLRWPIRFLPYFQLAVAGLFFYLCAHLGLAKPSRGRVGVSVGLLALGFVGSWQAQPENWPRHAAAAALGGLGIAALLWLGEARERGRQGVLIAITAVFVVATRIMFPSFWGETGFSPKPSPRTEKRPWVPRAFTFYSGRLTDLRAHGEFGSKQLPLLSNSATINGYTPLGHAAFQAMFCANGFGWTCPQAGLRLFERDAETGALMADLMRVDRLVAIRGEHLVAVQPLVTAEWQVALDGAYTRHFVRPLPNAALPGTLSWHSPAAGITGVARPRILNERVQVTSEAATTLIFARLYWPGYRAYVDGTRVPVSAHRSVFVRVDVPPGRDHAVSLVYRPPFMEAGLALAGLGLALALLVILLQAGRGAGGFAMGKQPASTVRGAEAGAP